MTTNTQQDRPAWLAGWLQRHRHPASLWLHLVGIPMVVAGVVVAVRRGIAGPPATWWLPAALFVGGYVLQWLGHRIEGNDLGEIVLVKKLLGKPYVAISPKYATGDEHDDV